MDSVSDFMAGLGVAWDAARTPAGLGIIAATLAVLAGVVWLLRRNP